MKRVIISTLIFLCFILNAQTSGGPDSYGYTWKSSEDQSGPVFIWQDISSTGTDLNLGDEGTYQANISGSFYFYGSDYSTVYIGANGWINFLKNTSLPNNPFIYSGAEPNAVIAPLAQDYNPSRPQSNVYYYDDSDKSIIQYDSLALFFDKGYYNFQIILDKSDSTIVFNYKSASPETGWQYNSGSQSLPVYPVTGIENHTGSTGLNIDNDLIKDNYSIKFYQPAAYIYYSPDDITFEDVWYGSADSVEITLLNSGKSRLQVNQIYFKNGSDLSLTSLPSDFPANPLLIDEVDSGDFEKFFVKLDPSAERSYDDSLIIISNSEDENSRLAIPVSGNSLAANITTESTSLDFGDTEIEYLRATKDRDLVISNTGSAGLIINENSTILNGTNFSIAKLPSPLPFTIPAGGQDTIKVRFRPLVSIDYTDTLKIYNNSLNSHLVSVPLNGRGVESIIGFVPSEVAFDSTVQGRTDTLTFNVENNGQYPLSVSSMRLLNNTSFSLINSPSSFDVSPGSFREIKVGFTPVTTGTQTDSVKFITNLPDDYYVKVSGEGILPVLTTNTTYLKVGSTLLNTSVDSSITITNTGIGTLVINNIYLTGNTLFEITDNFNFPVKLAPSSDINVNIRFLPTSLGFKFDDIKINSNVGTYTVQVQGKGIFPDIELSASSLNFGELQTGEVKPDSVIISNIGDADLIVNQLNFTNGTVFSVKNTMIPLTVAPGSDKKVYIEFAPLQSVAYSDQIDIISNSGEDKKINLYGNGTYPGIEISTYSVEFDSTLENMTDNRYVSIKNTGNQELTINSVKTGSDQFEVYLAAGRSFLRGDNDLNFNLAPGDSQRVRVEFRPSSNISYSDNLTISADLIGTSTVSLTGQGTRASYSLNPVSINFGETSVMQEAVQSIDITNTDNGKLIINNIDVSSEIFTIKNLPDFPLNLYPEDKLTLNIGFIPDTLKSYSELVSIISNSDNDKTLNLNGSGVGGALKFLSENINFGKVSVNSNKTDTVKIRNYGNKPLIINSVTIDDPLSVMTVISPSAYPFSIDPDNEIEIVVNFFPTGVTTYNNELTIDCNCAFSNSKKLMLSGEGVSSDIFLNPSELLFGNVHIDSSKVDSFSVVNIGNADLIITDLNFTDGNEFSLVNVPSLPLTIMENTSYRFKIKYASSVKSEVTDKLNIVNNAANNVFVSLSGTGSIGNLVISRQEVDFGNVDYLTKKEETVFIKKYR